MTGMTLDQAREHIGSDVVYRGGASSEDEEGVITSVNDTYVFVRYASQHPEAAGQATPAQHLELLTTIERAREARHAADTILCDECGTHTTDPETCPHGREHCPECRENGYACNQCGAEADPRWNR